MAWVRRVTRAGLGTAAVFGVLFATSVLFLDTLFGEAGRDVRVMASVGILINAAFQVVKVRNMIIGAGVLPSGNDVRGVILGDAVGAFVVGLPLAILLGLHTPLGFRRHLPRAHRRRGASSSPSSPGAPAASAGDAIVASAAPLPV